MSCRNGALIAICSGLLGGILVLAAEPPGAHLDSPSKHGTLLFRSGRTVEGQIVETPNSYLVALPVGKVEVAKSDIELVAQDLEEVYRYKAARINDSDADEHFRLAQWCLLVSLRDRAIEEFERTGQLSNPARVTGWLENLRRTPAARDRTASLPTGETTANSRPASTAPPYRQFLKELNPMMVSNFTIQIQPVLVKGCGSAGCHDGSHRGALALERPSIPTPKTTQKNLRTVLSLIDPDDAEQSPLLLESLRVHGGELRPAFPLGSQEPAYQTLLKWVRTVTGNSSEKPAVEQAAAPEGTPIGAAATAGPQKTLEDANSSPQQKVKKVNAPGTVVRSSANDSKGSIGQSSSSTELVSGTTDDAASLKLPAEPPARGEHYEPVDPFDPEIFNRRFAPRRAGQGS